MAAVSIASLSDRLQNIVQTFLFQQTNCNFLCKYCIYSNDKTQKDVSISEHQGATYSGFPFVVEQVAHTFHCIAYRHH
jgi:sulfatase maturation enzyme AslB (radical SAM superfamily)